MIQADWTHEYESMDELVADFGIEMPGWYQFGKDAYFVGNHTVSVFYERTVNEVKASLLWVLHQPLLPC